MLLLISESNEMETANINMFDKYSKQDEVYLYLQSMLVCQNMLVFRNFKVKCKIGSQCVYSVGKFKVKVTLDSLPDGALEVSGPKCPL